MPTKKAALITGITGQDGSYLAEFLLEKDYLVFGIIRRSSSFNTGRIDHMFNHPKLKLFHGDITDLASISTILTEIKETTQGANGLEVYNLAAQSHVKVSFEIPVYTGNVDAIGTLNLLEALRSNNLLNKVKIYQASTSELYGKIMEKPQNEKTPFYPRSPYGVVKLYSFWMIKNYREAYHAFACNGILFNHESPRRGATFVTRKITQGIANIMKGKVDCIYLGSLDSKRDWGHAKDFVRAMWLILQEEIPDDYVIATGEEHSVREFVERAFQEANIQLKWRGEGLSEEGYCQKTDKTYIKIDKRYFRPVEVDELLGDASYAREKLGWMPEYSFQELVNEMVKNDLEKC